MPDGISGVLTAIHDARHALSTLHGLWATDAIDPPKTAPELYFRIDTRRQRDALDAALDELEALWIERMTPTLAEMQETEGDEQWLDAGTASSATGC